MLNPALFFLLIWSVQIIGYLFYKESFGKYETETFFVVGIGIIFFTLGCGLAYWLFEKRNFASRFSFLTALSAIEKIDLTKFVIFFCFMYIFYGCHYASTIYEQIIIASKDQLHSFSDVRAVINYDFNNHRYFYGYFRFFQLGIVAIVFLFTFLKQIQKRWLAVLFVLGLISVVITTSRLFMLFYFLSLFGILSSYRILNAKQIALSIVGFLILFFGLAVVIKKGYGLNDPVELLKWNIQVYLFSPLAAFNNFVKNGVPIFDTILVIPNAIKRVLMSFGIDMGLRTNLMPFVEVPLRTNVYTFFYPLYHDGGKWLVGIMTLILGFIHQTFYYLSEKKKNPITIYVFSISLYPLALTFFEDAYFSSPGFLLFQIIPVVITVVCLITFNFAVRKYGVR